MFYYLIDCIGLFVYGGIIELGSLNISTHKGHWGFVVVIIFLGQNHNERLVGGESIQVKVPIEIRTSQHWGSGDGGFDIVERIFPFIIPLEFRILVNHLLQGLDDFGEVGSELPHEIDLPEKGLHGLLVMGEQELSYGLTPLRFYANPCLGYNMT